MKSFPYCESKRFPGCDHPGCSRWKEVVAISFWEQKENAQAYNSTGYPEVLKILEKFLDGTPHVRTFDVVSSTVQKVSTPVAARSAALVRDPSASVRRKAASLCAGHAQQLGGESPLAYLIEVEV